MRTLLGLLLLSLPALADSPIGVTAALQGTVERTASQSGAALGPLTSGAPVFEGDKISVGDNGRLQVMLNDQTTFTLGAGAEFQIDEFVFQESGSKLNANVTQGVFRFVSGKIAKQSKDAMTVDLPNATIGVRGTQVAGLIDDEGNADVLLVGPGPNSFGLTPGAIDISNAFGSTTLQRSGFSVFAGMGLEPSPPVQADPELIRRLEAAVQELAGEQIAEEVLSEYATSETVALAEALVSAGVTGDQSTNAVEVLELIVGEELAQDLAIQGVGFTGEAAYVLSQYQGDLSSNDPPPGPSVSDLVNSSLPGSYVYRSNNVTMTSGDGQGGNGAPLDPDATGSFNSVMTVNFDANTLGLAVNGALQDVAIAANEASNISFDFAFDQTASLSNLSTEQNGATALAFGGVTGFDFRNSSVDPQMTVMYEDLNDPQTPSDSTDDTARSSFPGNAVATISNYSIENQGSASTNGSLHLSINGSFANINETADLGIVNVTVTTVDDTTELSNVGGSGVSVRTPE